jgi:hypothetical protein
VGHLEILDENDIPLAGGIKSLPPNVNQHTFSDLPSSTGIKKLQVRYLSDDAVEVTVDGVPTTIMHETEWDSGRDFKIKYVNPDVRPEAAMPKDADLGFAKATLHEPW